MCKLDTVILSKSEGFMNCIQLSDCLIAKTIVISPVKRLKMIIPLIA